MVRHKMTNLETYYASRWVDEHRATVLHLSDSELSVMATADLGFKVTDSNIEGIRNTLRISKAGAGCPPHHNPPAAEPTDTGTTATETPAAVTTDTGTPAPVTTAASPAQPSLPLDAPGTADPAAPPAEKGEKTLKADGGENCNFIFSELQSYLSSIALDVDNMANELGYAGLDVNTKALADWRRRRNQGL